MINGDVISYKNNKVDSPMNIGLGFKEATNASLLSAYAQWCETLIQTRLQLYFGQECRYACVRDISPPQVANQEGTLAKFVANHQLDFDDQLLLALALMPTVKPQVLDVLLMRNDNIDRPYTEFGGAEHNGLIVANGETLAFLLGGDCVEKRLNIQLMMYSLLSGDMSRLRPSKKEVIKLLEMPEQAVSNPLKIPLVLATKHLVELTVGGNYVEQQGAGFPAHLVKSPQSLESLVLPDSVLRQLNDIQAWSQHGETLRHEWGMADRIRPGYRALFYGPSGTGKTMTAGVLGQLLGKDVYKVDLSRVHSKYIGETEKNLERVFKLAEQNGWVLFFDEADAVFGKRTQTSNSNDQFANQNVSYLLQRIECFTGLVILASNYKDNLDEAFFRRFESVIEFPKPESQQRLAIWQKGFSPKAKLAPDVDLKEVALKYPLSGASIMNVIRYVSLKAISESRSSITLSDLHEGIDKETKSSTQPRW